MKKETRLLTFAVLILCLFLFNLSFVQSQTNEFSSNLKEFASSFQGPITNFIENTVAFAKTLFFILVFLIVDTILLYIPIFGERKFIKTLVALIVSILSVYFIPIDLIKPMLNPYSALGITLISILPFILMFLFARYMLINTFLKKMAWLIFSVVLLGVTIYTAIQDKNAYTWIYGIASILSVVMVFAGNKIDKWTHIGALEASMTKAERDLQARLALDQLKLREAEAVGIPTGTARRGSSYSRSIKGI